jgi:hypothetical protein
MNSSSRTGWRRWVTDSPLFLGLIFCATSGFADSGIEKSEKKSNKSAVEADVADALREAVTSEVIGDEKARDARLDALIEAHPDLNTPRWLRGFVKTPEGWRKDELVELEIPTAETAYRELRDRILDDIAGNRKLARYCRKNKLTDTASGHWQRVLDFNPSDAEARKALGHVRFEGVWTTKPEIDRAAVTRKKYHASLADWGKKIPGWIADWRGDHPRTSRKAREHLLAIRDAAAIPVLYTSLAYHSEPETEFLLEILSAIPDIESTRVIAEIGVMNQSPQILRMCAEELKNRDEQSFAPQLLMGLSSPITAEMKLEFIPALGQFLYRHQFVRETQFNRQMQSFGEDYLQYQSHYSGTLQYYAELWKDPDDLAKANKRMSDDALKMKLANQNNTAAGADAAFIEKLASTVDIAILRERQRVLQNMSIEDTNGRISLLLAKVFDENHGRPEQWWKWWNNRHEQKDNVQKPLNRLVQYQTNVDVFQTFSCDQKLTVLQKNPSCFIAGTPVVTSQGMRPIETLKTGDVVLSQNIETGELTWKPVVCPTIRPPTDVLKLTVGDESLVCTLKHPLWKVGHGWIWAKELVEGDLIRTSSGTLPVSAIEPQGKAQVHNLVVADFNTYFVGKSRLLTHDTTMRAPTLAIAPGVFAKED